MKSGLAGYIRAVRAQVWSYVRASGAAPGREGPLGSAVSASSQPAVNFASQDDLSSVQCAVVLAGLEIVGSSEGKAQRQVALERAVLLRTLLKAEGVHCLGDPSPTVSVVVGDEALARLVSKHLLVFGLGADLVEYPAVAKGAARFQLHVTAEHTKANVRFAAAIFSMALGAGRTEFADMASPAGRRTQPVVDQSTIESEAVAGVPLSAA